MTEDAALLAHHGPGTERARLTDGPNLELVRTLDVLERVLPPAPASVLDLLRRIEHEPALLGASAHVLAVATRGAA